jgi:hypothetical protein
MNKAELEFTNKKELLNDHKMRFFLSLMFLVKLFAEGIHFKLFVRKC